MRLLKLNGRNEFSLTKDLLNNISPYTILSHTWGSDEDEVASDDLQYGAGKIMAGYAKLQFCERQARKDDIECSGWTHAELTKLTMPLSEAIASMFRWYRDAKHCCVY
jgi:hypothetical protein